MHGPAGTDKLGEVRSGGAVAPSRVDRKRIITRFSHVGGSHKNRSGSKENFALR